MKAAFIPEVNDELDTQNFEKFEEADYQISTAAKTGPWRKVRETDYKTADSTCIRRFKTTQEIGSKEDRRTEEQKSLKCTSKNSNNSLHRKYSAFEALLADGIHG
ncbi:hypothetical protein AgCh_005774 [Apium graveolens]